MLNMYAERVEEVRVTDMPRTQISPRGSSISRWRREALSLWQASLLVFRVRYTDVYSQVESSRPYTRTHFYIIVTSGVSTSQHIHGIALKRKFGLRLAPATGMYAIQTLWLLIDSACRMAMWKHYVVLFGGFYDPGIRSASYIYSQQLLS